MSTDREALTEAQIKARVDLFDRQVVTMVVSLTARDLRAVVEWFNAADDPLPVGVIQFAASARQGYALRYLECSNDVAAMRAEADADSEAVE